MVSADHTVVDPVDPPLRQCQKDCLEACAKGARKIEMACGTGKTRVMKELVSNVSGKVSWFLFCTFVFTSIISFSDLFVSPDVSKYLFWRGEAWQQQVLITVPLRVLLDQFAPDFPAFCKVGTSHNSKIDYEAKGFISVTKSVDLLQNVSFDAVLVDEAHHPLPPGLPKCEDMFQFSATLGDNTEFNYSMGQAIQDGILCDYDITVPAITAHHAYVCLADLLLKQAGRFRRVLAYCNSVAEAKKFQMVLQELGLAAWHINAFTTQKKRKQIMDEFTGVLRKPGHVLVTVEVLGEGINIPNADTCMFVEPRNSYRSIVQAIGRVLRHHRSKAIAHIVLPAFATPPSRSGQLMPVSAGVERDAPLRQQHSEVFQPLREPPSLAESLNQMQHRPVMDIEQEPGADSRPTANKKNKVKQSQAGLALRREGAWDKAQISERSKLVKKLAQAPQQQHALEFGRAGKYQSNGDDVANYKENCCRGHLQNAKIIESGSQGSLSTQRHHASNSVVQDVSPSARPKQSYSWIACGPTHQNPNTGLWENLAKTKHEFRSKNCTSQGKHGSLDRLQLAEADSSQVNLCNSSTETRTRKKQSPRMTFKLIKGDRNHVSLFGQEYSSQLERFLSVLILADQRLVGITAAHRIQVIDCRKSSDSELGMQMLEDIVYERLSAVLHRTDPWELKLQRLEEFVESRGMLPAQRSKTAHERSLANWLKTQGWLWKKGELEVRKWECLLETSSQLIGFRLAKWMSGENAETMFRQKCKELKTYIEAHGQLPYISIAQGNVDLGRNQLARWLASLRERNQRGILAPSRRRDLQEVHPLVANLPDQWDTNPVKMDLKKWDKRLEKVTSFVLKHGRLPGGKFGEYGEYRWLNEETRRFITGKLPAGCIEKMQRAHPLIAEKLQWARGLKRGRDTWAPGNAEHKWGYPLFAIWVYGLCSCRQNCSRLLLNTLRHQDVPRCPCSASWRLPMVDPLTTL